MSVEPRKIKKLVHNLREVAKARKEAFPENKSQLTPKKISRATPEMRVTKESGVEVIKEDFLPKKKRVTPSKLSKPLREVKGSSESTPRIVEGMVTLAQLAKERDVQAQLARLWVTKAGMTRPTAGWRWKVGSRDLAKARKALGLP